MWVVALVTAGLAGCAPEPSWTPRATEAASVSPDGTIGNLTSSESAPIAISGDGRYVAFFSHASNLVPGDSGGFPDIFVRDGLTGTTERVSVRSTQTSTDVLIDQLIEAAVSTGWHVAGHRVRENGAFIHGSRRDKGFGASLRIHITTSDSRTEVVIRLETTAAAGAPH